MYELKPNGIVISIKISLIFDIVLFLPKVPVTYSLLPLIKKPLPFVYALFNLSVLDKLLLYLGLNNDFLVEFH